MRRASVHADRHPRNELAGRGDRARYFTISVCSLSGSVFDGECVIFSESRALSWL